MAVPSYVNHFVVVIITLYWLFALYLNQLGTITDALELTSQDQCWNCCPVVSFRQLLRSGASHPDLTRTHASSCPPSAATVHVRALGSTSPFRCGILTEVAHTVACAYSRSEQFFPSLNCLCFSPFPSPFPLSKDLTIVRRSSSTFLEREKVCRRRSTWLACCASSFSVLYSRLLPVPDVTTNTCLSTIQLASSPLKLKSQIPCLMLPQLCSAEFVS